VDKRRLHHLLVVLKRVKTWQLPIVLVLLVVASAYLLRQNNLGMIELRNLVKQADEDDGDVQKALTDLRRYVTSHMNTSLGEGIFLEHSYQRAYDAAVQAAAAQTVSPDSQAYKAAEKTCKDERRRTGSFQNYIKCVEDHVKAIAPVNDPLSVKPLPAELYTPNFVSPTWSPDLAGFTVLAALLVALLLVLRLLFYMALRLLLKIRIRH